MNKRAMELSINIVVILVIGIVLFGSGFVIVKKIIHEGDRVLGDLDQNLKDQMETLCFLEGNAVCALDLHATISSGEYKDFGFGFVNEMSEHDSYFIDVSYNPDSPVQGELVAAQSVDHTINPDDSVIYLSRINNKIELEPNDEYFFPVRIIPARNLPRGTYLFDVTVCSSKSAEGVNDCLSGSGNPTGYGPYHGKIILTVKVQ